jgi:hypothetical protein
MSQQLVRQAARRSALDAQGYCAGRRCGYSCGGSAASASPTAPPRCSHDQVRQTALAQDQDLAERALHAHSTGRQQLTVLGVQVLIHPRR